ncbi:MAG: hypothetical protein JXA28_12825 [Bacteroidetes bacterium]|nr:hypothetical protein [Bacteroidota bacterium]
MRTRRFFPLLLLLALPAVVLVSGCSDDDDNPADPNKGYQQVNIRLHSGDQFTYDRYDLDENNQKVTTSKRKYDVSFFKGNSLLINYNDWFYRIGKDLSTNERDTLLLRTETITRSSDGSAYTESVMVYGFVYQMLQYFIGEIIREFNPSGIPTIPGQTWDVIARYYDGDGNALDPGAEWEIGPEGGITMNFTFSGQVIPVEATIKGKLEAREEKVMAGNKEVTTWKSSVTVTLDVMSSVQLSIPLIFWFSDNPSTMVKYEQQSASVMLPFLGTLTLDGETQELVSWF